jgi:imidazolonepropionase-like amidohydrolase
MLLRDPVSMKSALGENPKRVYGEKKVMPSTRLGVAAIIRDAFTKAQDYKARKEHAAAEGKPFDRDLTYEALVQVLDGALPWCQHSHRADDIATAIRLADEFGYRLVINHGTEAHLLADLLAERDIPVIMGPFIVSRSKVEVRARDFRNPGILARAGVRIAITTDAPVVPINFLVHQATFAVKDGLDAEAAIRSITVNPAQMLDLDDRVGALKPGLDADLVIWSGDPLDVMSRAMRVFIEGREVYRFDEATGAGITENPFYKEA